MALQRERWLDASKGLLAVFVIIGHVNAPDAVIKAVYAFHMPAFFIVAGYVFNEQRWQEQGNRRFLLGRARRLLRMRDWPC